MASLSEKRLPIPRTWALLRARASIAKGENRLVFDGKDQTMIGAGVVGAVRASVEVRWTLWSTVVVLRGVVGWGGVLLRWAWLVCLPFEPKIDLSWAGQRLPGRNLEQYSSIKVRMRSKW